jgi:hypothetical protein
VLSAIWAVGAKKIAQLLLLQSVETAIGYDFSKYLIVKYFDINALPWNSIEHDTVYSM